MLEHLYRHHSVKLLIGIEIHHVSRDYLQIIQTHGIDLRLDVSPLAGRIGNSSDSRIGIVLC